MIGPKSHSSDFERTSSRTDRPETAGRQETDKTRADIDERFYTHLLTVLSVSSGMVGVCLTAIGLIGIIKSMNKVEMIVDDLLAIGALVFMVAAAMSFLGMRTRLGWSWRGFARTLDLVFCGGLVIVVVATLLLTWMVI
jgi:hypothetical protein